MRGDGYYCNRFKAVPSMFEVIPMPDVRFPNAETQMATVTRNDDPKGQWSHTCAYELADRWYADKLGACDDTRWR